MRLHPWLALAALTVLPAFAPAPFPRAREDRTKIDLERFQGMWKVVSLHQGHGAGRLRAINWTITHIRVQKDQWTLLAAMRENATYRIELTPTRKPCLIDWRGPQGEALWLGLIRRDGEQVEVLYGSSTSRPGGFKQPPSGSYLITLRRHGSQTTN
jgi:uncharacterized protein (TIGR03067 family)